MADDTKVNWQTEKVIAILGEKAKLILKELAIETADVAALNIEANKQVDTGFLMNSAYAIWPGGDNHAKAEAAATGLANRPFAANPGLPDDQTAAVHVAAEYAVYQEMRKPFLFPALMKKVAEFGGIVERNKI
jgi:hypothetical protein